MSHLLRPLVLLLLVFGISACAALQQSIKQPEVRVSQVDIVRVSLTDMDLGIVLGIDNPNPFGIALAGLNYRLEIAQRPVIQGRSDQRVKLAAGGKSRVSLPLSLHYSDMADGLEALLSQESIAYRLSGDLNFGLVTVPYSHRGEVRLPSLPKIRIDALQVERIGLQGAVLLLSLGMDNPNDFPIRLNGLQYDLALAGKTVSRGQGIGPMEVKAGSKASNPLRVELDYASLGNLFSTLSSGGRIPVSFDAGINLPGLRGEQRLPLSWQGEVAISR